jgi:hypothetical protein
VTQDDGLPGQPAAADGVVGAWSCVQGEERGCVTGHHEAGGLHLFRGVCLGGAGAAAIFLLPHATGVLRAPAAASISQLHRSGGHLRPPLRDVCGGTAIGAAVLVLLRAEGCEHTPTTHRRLLLPAPDTGPHPLHRAHFPWQVGTVERRMGAGAGGRPRPACTSHRRPDPQPHRVGERSRPRAGFRPRAGSDPVPGRERPNFTDGAARLPVKVPHASPGLVPPPRMDVHRGERHHAAGLLVWV